MHNKDIIVASDVIEAQEIQPMSEVPEVSEVSEVPDVYTSKNKEKCNEEKRRQFYEKRIASFHLIMALSS